MTFNDFNSIKKVILNFLNQMPENKKYKIFFKKDRKIKEKIKKKIDKYGFCVIENVLSKFIVNSLIKELKVANNKINKNIQNIIDCENKGISANEIYKKISTFKITKK